MMRRYTFKMYPNKKQMAVLDRQMELHRHLWNACVLQRRTTPLDRGVTWCQQGRELTALRAEDPEYGALARASTEYTVKAVDLAYSAFFRRGKENKQKEKGDREPPGVPRYKRRPKRNEPASFGFGKPSGWKLRMRHDGRAGVLRLHGVPDTIRVRGEFPLPPLALKTCNVMWHDRKWWLSVCVDIPGRMYGGGKVLAVEYGFDDLQKFASQEVNGGCAAAISGHSEIEMSRHTNVMRQCGGAIPADVETPQEGVITDDAGRGGAVPADVETPQEGVQKWSDQPSKRRRQRREHLHKWSTEIVRRSKKVIVTIPEMKKDTRSTKGNDNKHGAFVRTKAEFNKRLLDMAPAMLAAMIEYKAEEAGIEYEIRRQRNIIAVAVDAAAQAIEPARKLRRRSK